MCTAKITDNVIKVTSLVPQGNLLLVHIDFESATATLNDQGLASCNLGLLRHNPHDINFQAWGSANSAFDNNKKSHRTILASSIPSLESQVFNPNPSNYFSFVDAYDTSIAFNAPESKRRLYSLQRYTTRPAYALVMGC